MSRTGTLTATFDPGKRAVHHVAHQPRHVRDVDVRLERRLLVQFERPLGDVHRQVADPLDVGDDLERGHDEAQIGGDRLAAGEHEEGEFVDLDLVAVDRLIALDHLARRGVVAPQQRVDRPSDLLLGAAAHGEQALAQPLQLPLELATRVQRHQPNFPVT